jgi:hypothetical protein
MTSTYTKEYPPQIAPAAPGTASEWIEKFSDKYQRKYWKNTLTGESTWKDPFKLAKA